MKSLLIALTSLLVLSFSGTLLADQVESEDPRPLTTEELLNIEDNAVAIVPGHATNPKLVPRADGQEGWERVSSRDFSVYFADQSVMSTVTVDCAGSCEGVNCGYTTGCESTKYLNCSPVKCTGIGNCTTKCTKTTTGSPSEISGGLNNSFDLLNFDSSL